MPDLTDILEALFRGQWKYLTGLLAGAAVLILIRLLFSSWRKRQDSADAAFVERHQFVPVAELKKKAGWTMLILILLLIAVLPGSLWLVVRLLEDNEGMTDGIKLLIVLALALGLILMIAIQAVRLRRARRRIKRMGQALTPPDQSMPAH